MPRYVVIRTDKQRAAFILRELEQGRLRQGWGWKPEQDLRLIRQKVNARGSLTHEEASAWRNRRLLDTESDGLKPEDVVIIPNQPSQGRWLLARVVGPYRYEQPTKEDKVGTDYAHVLPVGVIKTKDGRNAVVEADNAYVDARLRASMRSMSRMWSLDALAEKIERIIGAISQGEDTSIPQPEEHKFKELSSAMSAAAWDGIRSKYKGAELEKLVLRVLGKVYDRIEHWGGAGEKGADLIAFTQDPLGLEFKIGVQVKLHEGQDDDTTSLNQIKWARAAHGIDAGIVLTTATSLGEGFVKRHDELQTELGIDIRVITRDEFVRLLLTHLGAPERE